ncbi:unnamed protein product [Porites lobata]|uniref:GRAM domain-containing protein n=1 Tax=Porites lobata TaxID=104759 RepID=A0ABN8R1L7_9CNID|nr:unnamed protein product [Porites lobata]
MSYKNLPAERRSPSSDEFEVADDKTVSFHAPILLEEMANRNFEGPPHATSGSIDMDFLASIAPPVVSQPQAFSDTMLDPASRGIMTGLTTAHMSGTTLQSVVRQSADQLQRTVQGQFVSLKGNMSYRDLLAGLIYEGESFQALNNFTFMNYTNVQFCDDAGIPLTQRSGGICLLTNKRILFLSSQLTVGTSLAQWGNPKKLPGGYSLTSSCNDTTYYLPIPLRCLRSVEMSGETGVRADLSIHGVAPCCCGWCGLCGLWGCCADSGALKQWRPQPMNRSQVQEMFVTVGLLMPPWDRKMFLKIYIDPNVPLPVTRDFVALLQKNSPGLC